MEDLAELHSLLLDLEEVEEMLRTGPLKVAAQQKRSEQKLAECEQQKAHITALRKAVDGKQLQLKTNEARIGDLRGKLNAASSNREYEIITSQIDADTMANSVLEDEILEALEKVDVAVTDLATMDEQHKAQVTKQKKLATEVESATAGLEARAAELNGKIDEAEKAVPTNVKDQYRRLRSAHKAGALSAVESNACVACYSELSAQRNIALNLNKVLFCDSCGRLLYKVRVTAPE